ncbi:MAG: hypothetical protein K1X74_09815 [Pirellulales bacterium]|nr:hypothetical protein [Pirellulales bacterium]
MNGIFSLGAGPTFPLMSYWAPADGGNGHVYEYVNTPLNWQDAASIAASQTRFGVSGHLAVIGSAEENMVVHAVGSADPIFSHGWIGLSQPPGSGEPTADFGWITGEPLTYTNWSGGEPNDAGDEDFGTLQTSGTWNDLNGTNHPNGYFVEYETTDQVFSSDTTLNTFGTSTLAVQALLAGDPISAPFTSELTGWLDARFLYTPGPSGPQLVGVSLLDSRADADDTQGVVDLSPLGTVDFSLVDAAAALRQPFAQQGVFVPISPDGSAPVDDLVFQFLDGHFDYVSHGGLATLVGSGTLDLVDDFVDFRIGDFSPGLRLQTQVLPTPDPSLWEVEMFVPVRFRDRVFEDSNFLEIDVTAAIELRGFIHVVPEPAAHVLAACGLLGLIAARTWRRPRAARRRG